MHISRIHLKNICGIQNLDLPLVGDQTGPYSTLLIGKNGTGKSSVLRSVVLGLASPTQGIALLAEPFGSPFISMGRAQGSIALDIHGDDSVNSVAKTIQRNRTMEEIITGDSMETTPFVVAFGAGRSNEGRLRIRTFIP